MNIKEGKEWQGIPSGTNEDQGRQETLSKIREDRETLRNSNKNQEMTKMNEVYARPEKTKKVQERHTEKNYENKKKQRILR